jgi:hypothetical protein
MIDTDRYRAVYAERFGPPVRSRNSLALPSRPVADEHAWARLHALRIVDVPVQRDAAQA